MEYKQFINLVKQRKQTVLIITLVFLMVVALFTFLQPLKYSATSTLLVVQNYGPNTDAYNVSRSNQFLSSLLAQVVYSDSFYEKVMASGYNINKNIFSTDTNKRKKEWQSLVYTHAISDTGMITLKTYHQDKAVADKLNQAIAYTLMTKNGQYHGLGNSVTVKIIDNSTLSDWPVKPNVILNLILGLIVGLAVSLYFIYLFPERELWIRKRQTENLKQDLSYTTETWQAEPTIPVMETDTDNNYGWQPGEVSPEMVYNQEEAPVENIENISESGAEEIEEAEDEFEPIFKGNINNLIQS
jgi:capsular polysaccharide biosynthesis protein